MRRATRACRLWLAAISAVVILVQVLGAVQDPSARAGTLPGVMVGGMHGIGTQAAAPQASVGPSDAKCEFLYWSQCTSLNQSVSVDSISVGDTSDCSFAETTDWGDGTPPTTTSFFGGTNGTIEDAGDHTYTTPGTYAITATGAVIAGWCSISTAPVTFTLTCEQATQPDGSYEFGGCVTPEDDETQDVTVSASNLDGIGVSASPSDLVSYDDGGGAGDELTSAGDSTLSLDLDGTPIPIFEGPLGYSLTGPITVRAPAKLAGIGLSGKLDLTPGPSGGSLTATATATLPPMLGGGTGKLTATSTVNKGLTKAVVTLDKASFLQLFKLTNIALTWTSGSGRGDATWQVKATASAGGTKRGTLTGSLTYSDDTLTAATLSVKGLSLAGLTDLTALNITYGGAGWQGTATLGSGASASTATISAAFDDSGLASATINASNISLFGVLKVQNFLFSYAGGSWNLTATGADGGGVSATMTTADGAISNASLTVTKLSFLGKFTVDTASVSYAAQAPNSHCADVTGDSIWCGDWSVQLPSASTIDGVSGTLAVADGSFASGSIDVKGSVPLLDGVVLTELGGKVTINPPPTTIAGTVGLRFGPKIKGTSLIDLTGTLTRQLPGDGTSGSYDLDGSVNVLSVLHGTAKVTVPGDGSATTFDLTADASVGKASASGKLTGSFTSDSFTLAGSVEIKVLGHQVSGTLKADSNGMAACGKYHGYQAGFEYHWTTESVTFLGTKGCSEAGF
jgi:hypothetical protein